MVNKNNIAELTIENQDFRIKIKTVLASSVLNQPSALLPQMQTQVAPQMQQAVESDKSIQSVREDLKTEAAGSGNTITIKSPIVGTFYRSSGPDKEVFVKVGDEIVLGSKLCIIEAMKLFNEIESEVAGKIVKILVDDASPVEYDQPLFLIEPK